MLCAVLARYIQSQWSEVVVYVCQRAPGDDGQRALQTMVEALECGNDTIFHPHCIRLRCDVHQRAVEIEKECMAWSQPWEPVHCMGP